MDAADELLHTKLTRRPTPRKTTYLGPPPQQHPSVASRRGRVPVPMPTRPASPVPPTTTAADENHRGRHRRGSRQHRDNDDDDGDDDGADQASRIWAKIRRCSGLSLTDRTNMSLGEEQSLAAKRGIPPKASVKGRKGSGRWGFGNWWA